MIAVLLLGYGAPDSIEAVTPFLTNLLGERRPTGEQLERIKERYRLIGGKSPLLDITIAQARALERALNVSSPILSPRERGAKEGVTGLRFKVYVGMRYWHPLIEETVEEIVADGIAKVVALSLSPHYSRTTTGSYFKELERVVAEKAPDLKVIRAQDWFTHPLFVQAITENIREGLAKFPEGVKNDVEVIFSAHSLPTRFILDGDPYVEQVKATVKAVIDVLCLVHWRLAYQSSRRGTGEEWLEPDLKKVLEELASAVRSHVLLVPVGFVSDHVETLYDIDIALRRRALELGLNFHRTAALNDSPKFISALADIVVKSLV